MKCRLLVVPFAAAALGTYCAADDVSSSISSANCTFLASPDKFLAAQGRVRREIFERAGLFKAASVKQAASAGPIAHRNFIDDEIFNKLASLKVQPARLTTDEEFFRRINLDLTGRLP